MSKKSYKGTCSAITEAASSSETSIHEYIYHTARKKVKVKVTLEQATKAQRGARGIALLFL